MKKSILILTVCTFMTTVLFTSCSTSSEKVKDAEKNVAEANKDLQEANEAYLSDIETYRTETAGKIAANDQSIVEFKARIAKDKKEAKAEYNEKIAALEQKNTDMKKKMDDYKADGKDKWEAFKTEFSHDMDEMGKAIKDLTVNNVK